MFYYFWRQKGSKIQNLLPVPEKSAFFKGELSLMVSIVTVERAVYSK